MAWHEGACEYCGRVTMVGKVACSGRTLCVPCFNRAQGRGSCGTYRTHQRCAFCRVPSLVQVEICVLRRQYQVEEGHQNREALKAFMEEAWALDERKATAKAKAAMRKRAPALIKAACQEQNKAGEGVMPPNMCVLCHGCVIGAIVEAVSN